MKHVNTKAEGQILPGDGTNAITATCEMREGDIFVKERKFFGPPGMMPLTPIERLKNYNRIGEHNTTALGAAD